ncbi:MAG: hypothetical protein ACR2OU_08210 [Thermomicrobiales bacterium]
MRISSARTSQGTRRKQLSGVNLKLVGLVGLLSLLITACGSEAKPAATSTVPPIITATATATPAAVSTPATPVLRDGVVWSTTIDPVTGAPGGDVTEIPQSAKTVYAFVQYGGMPARTSLSATWTIDGTPIPGILQSITVDTARGAGWIEFHLDWTAAGTWPRGALGISIEIDGKPMTSGSVQIVAG